MDETRIEGDIVSFDAADSEAGARYTVRCPTCKDTINVAESPWWNTACSCGFRWRVIAIGEKD